MTPLEAIEAPMDYLTTNQWLLELEGVPHASFSNVSGVNRNVGTLTRTDGGTGLVYTFPNQLKNYGPLTFTRQRDPEDPNDLGISAYVTDAIENAVKLSGELVKLHRGLEVFRIRFTGLLFHTEQYPAFNKNTGSGFDVNYPASVDFWEEV